MPKCVFWFILCIASCPSSLNSAAAAAALATLSLCTVLGRGVCVDIEVISLLHHGLMERKVLAGSRATRVDMNLHSVKMPGMWS